MDRYKIAKFFLKWPFRLIYRIKVVGKENEPEAPFIVCANHSSFCDPILVTVAMKSRPRWIAKQELRKIAIMRFVFWLCKVIPINRQATDMAAIRASLAVLKEGEPLGIFPQGTRMRRINPKPEQALNGLALLACLSKQPVLPVSIVTKRRMPGPFRRTTVIIHKPISYEEYTTFKDSPTHEEITAYIFSKVCEPFTEEPTK